MESSKQHSSYGKMHNVQRNEQSIFNATVITAILFAMMLIVSSGTVQANISFNSTDSVTISAEITSAEQNLIKLQEEYAAAELTYQDIRNTLNKYEKWLQTAYSKDNLKQIAIRTRQIEAITADLQQAEANLNAIEMEISATLAQISSLQASLEDALIAEAQDQSETETQISAGSSTTDTDTVSGELQLLEEQLLGLQDQYAVAEATYLAAEEYLYKTGLWLETAISRGDEEQIAIRTRQVEDAEISLLEAEANLNKIAMEIATLEDEILAINGGSVSDPVDETQVVASNEEPVSEPDVVEEVITGNATISWVAPITRADGSPISLSEIKEFKIYHGNASGEYTNSVVISDPSQTSHVIDSLEAGTHYFVLTTIDTDGLESSYSSEKTFAVN